MRQNDMLDKPIEIGDCIAFADRDSTRAFLRFGIVTKITEDGVNCRSTGHYGNIVANSKLTNMDKVLQVPPEALDYDTRQKLKKKLPK